MNSKVAANQEEGGKVIPDYIMDNCANHPNKIFLTQPLGNDVIREWTYSQFLSESQKMAAHIESLDLPVPSQIAIMSKNCAWWLMADLAIMMTGHVGVPIYPTLTSEMTRYMLEHSEAKLLFVGKLDYRPWNEMKKGIPKDMECISLPLCPNDLKCDKWNDLIEQNNEIKVVKKRFPEELATITYTSGTTGVPKGVMLSFQAITEPTLGLISLLEITEKDRYLSYLPISHGMERWVGECVPFISGYHVYFTEDPSTFRDDLIRCKPTLFVSVPRLYTKFQQSIFEKVPPHKLETLLRIPILKTLVKKKILRELGLDKCRFAGCGSAPLPSDLLTWYRNLGLELLEGYGMTENFQYCNITRPGRGRVGYGGEPYPGVEQRIAEDGELQVKSPGMMMGYFKQKDLTKEAITTDGWLRTGDKGELDEIGRFKFTGRRKEIFNTSNGMCVTPAPIESQYISHPKVELACVGGRDHKNVYVIVLLGDEAKKIAADNRARAELEEEFIELLAKVNEGLDEHEKIQFIAIVNEEWLPENGFVTPTNKIKRSKIEEEHAKYLDEWYGSKKAVVWHMW